MKLSKLALAPAVAALALAGMTFSASAQSQYTNGPNGTQPNTLKMKPHYQRSRALTVRRRVVAPTVVAAPEPAPAAPGLIGAPIGAASTIAGLPFQVLGGVFPAGGPRKGGVTAVRYAGAGPEVNKIDEGWEAPVPVDRSGPVFVVDNGDPTVSPLVLLGAPIGAAGTLVQTPFRILGATGL